MKQKALRAGDAHSHEDEECRKRSTLPFGRCLTSATGAQQRRMCRGTFFLIFLREITGKGNEVP